MKIYPKGGGRGRRVLEDERLGEFLAESVEEMLDEILDEGLDLAGEHPRRCADRNALEEALVTILADGRMRAAIGDLAGDLASDRAAQSAQGNPGQQPQDLHRLQ